MLTNNASRVVPRESAGWKHLPEPKFYSQGFSASSVDNVEANTWILQEGSSLGESRNQPLLMLTCNMCPYLKRGF